MVFVAGTALSAAQLNSQLGVYQLRASMNSSQAIGTSLTTLTNWTNVQDAFYGFNSTTGVFTCPAGFAGSYLALANVSWISSAVRRMSTIYQNATELSRADTVSGTGRLTHIVEPLAFDLAVGDTVSVQCLGGSATTLDNGPLTQFFLWKIG